MEKTTKGHHKRKKGVLHEENEVTEQDMEPKKVTSHNKKRKKMQSSMAPDVNELSLTKNPDCDADLEAASADINTKKTKKGHKKGKRDVLDKENEVTELGMQSDEAASHGKKRKKVQKSQANNVNESALSENPDCDEDMKAASSDINLKNTKKGHHKRKRDALHKEKEASELDVQPKDVASHKKKRKKMQRSMANDVNESVLNETPDCDVDAKAAGSKAKSVSDKQIYTAGRCQTNKEKKQVRFSNDAEVIHSTKKISKERKKKMYSGDIKCGYRYTEEEDQIIRDACLKYVEDHNLHEGVKMILNVREYPQARGCWKEICASIPWRKVNSVINRTAYIFRERTEFHKWTPEEIDLIKSFVNEHGRKFKELSKLFNVHRHQVKDAWRRNRHPDARKGKWSVDEYQKFFELVNEDLKMKAFEEKSENAMVRENISWWAISDKLLTRYDPSICTKWYVQMTSRMVSQGLWHSCDDYRLLFSLSKLDACCFEDVDWDNLLKHRDGDLCRKRWLEMTKHIGGNTEKPFTEQVELLSSRYHIDILEYRKISLLKADGESEGLQSDNEAEPENT